MANFLQISEPEAAQLDQQAATEGDAQRLKDQSANALVAQYGPEAADPELQQQAVTANTDQQTAPDKVTATHLALDQSQRADEAWQAQHALAFVRQQVANGTDAATALGNLTPETYSALGVNPDQVAPLVNAVRQNPKLLDQIGEALAPIAAQSKMVGSVQWAQDKDGKYHALYPMQDASTGAIKYQEGSDLPDGYSLLGETRAQADANTVKAGYVPPGMAGGPTGAAGSASYAKPSLTTIKTPTGQALSVNQAIAPQAAGLLHDLQAAGYSVTDVGGYNNRNVAGTNIASAHSAGLAIDINSAQNADHTAGNIPPDLARSLAKKYGAVWGGDFKSNRDPMHFSWASSEGGSVPWKATGPAQPDGSAPAIGSAASPQGAPQLTPAAQARAAQVDIAQARLKLAAEHEARVASTTGEALSPQAVDYMADQYRLTGRMPALGMGGAGLRVQILNSAADKARAAGANGQADAYTAQATHERATAVTDLGRAGQNNAGGRIQSFNALTTHLDQLSDLSSALTSGQIPLINAAKQRYMQETGNPAPTNFNVVRSIAADEAAKLIVGARVTEADRKQLQAQFAAAQSPQQLSGVIQQAQHLAVGQLSGMRQRYQAIGATNEFDATLSPRAKQLLGLGQPAPAAAAPGGYSPAAMRSKYGM